MPVSITQHEINLLYALSTNCGDKQADQVAALKAIVSRADADDAPKVEDLPSAWLEYAGHLKDSAYKQSGTDARWCLNFASGIEAAAVDLSRALKRAAKRAEAG